MSHTLVLHIAGLLGPVAEGTVVNAHARAAEGEGAHKML